MQSTPSIPPAPCDAAQCAEVRAVARQPCPALVVSVAGGALPSTLVPFPLTRGDSKRSSVALKLLQATTKFL